MAQRKAPQTEPVLDNSALAANPELEQTKRVYCLTKGQYSSIIHQVQTLDTERIVGILNVSKAKLAELGVSRTFAPHRNKAKGSGQLDLGTFVTWVNGIKPDDVESIKQLQGIDATVALRFPNDK